MEQWTEVRRRVLTGELSKRGACREYEISWHTLAKMLEFEEPPGYRQTQPRGKPLLEPFLPIIYEILKSDRQAPRKQRHTAPRISIVRDFVCWMRYGPLMEKDNLPTPLKEYAEIAQTHQRAIDILRSNGTDENIALLVEAKLQEIIEHVLEKHSVNLLSYLAVEH